GIDIKVVGFAKLPDGGNAIGDRSVPEQQGLGENQRAESLAGRRSDRNSGPKASQQQPQGAPGEICECHKSMRFYREVIIASVDSREHGSRGVNTVMDPRCKASAVAGGLDGSRMLPEREDCL